MRSAMARRRHFLHVTLGLEKDLEEYELDTQGKRPIQNPQGTEHDGAAEDGDKKPYHIYAGLAMYEQRPDDVFHRGNHDQA